MKTICIKLNNRTERTDLPKLNEESIHICSPNGKEYGWFAVGLTEKITITLNAGTAKFKYSTYNLQDAIDSQNVYESKELSSGKYYFFIAGIFDGLLTFSDITKVQEFDATHAGASLNEDTGKYIGLYLYVNDLIKLSMVEVLLIRYSLVGFNQSTVLDMRPFQSLKKLYIGTPDSEVNLLDEIILEDSTIQKLEWLNTNVNRIPSNLKFLTNCVAIYLQGNISWLYLRGDKYDSELKVNANITIGSCEESDVDAVIYFLYINKDKFINITLSANYSYIINNPNYLSKLMAICESTTNNNGALKFGNKTAIVNGDNISLN